MSVLFDYLLGDYSTYSIEIQKKAKILIIINIVLIILPTIMISLLLFGFKLNPFLIIAILIFIVFDIISLILINKHKYQASSFFAVFIYSIEALLLTLTYEMTDNFSIFYVYIICAFILLIIASVISVKQYHIFIIFVMEIISFMIVAAVKFSDFFLVIRNTCPG